jgi:hypothetical protein
MHKNAIKSPVSQVLWFAFDLNNWSGTNHPVVWMLKLFQDLSLLIFSMLYIKAIMKEDKLKLKPIYESTCLRASINTKIMGLCI